MEDKQATLGLEKCRQIGRSCGCYNLRRAARVITRFYENYLRPSGLKPTQFSVLMAVHARGPIPLTKLADMTVTERSTLTRNLNVLEKKGFMKITEGTDRRERLIEITDIGREVLINALPLWEQAQAHIEKELGKDRMENLLDNLEHITAIARN